MVLSFKIKPLVKSVSNREYLFESNNGAHFSIRCHVYVSGQRRYDGLYCPLKLYNHYYIFSYVFIYLFICNK